MFLRITCSKWESISTIKNTRRNQNLTKKDVTFKEWKKRWKRTRNKRRIADLLWRMNSCFLTTKNCLITNLESKLIKKKQGLNHTVTSLSLLERCSKITEKSLESNWKMNFNSIWPVRRFHPDLVQLRKEQTKLTTHILRALQLSVEVPCRSTLLTMKL